MSRLAPRKVAAEQSVYSEYFRMLSSSESELALRSFPNWLPGADYNRLALEVKELAQRIDSLTPCR